jgi:hypothetical protein
MVCDHITAAGTGNVLKVQELLAACGEHIEAATEEGNAWKAMHQVGVVTSADKLWPRRHAQQRL